MTKKSVTSMTLGQFMDRPQKKNRHRSVLFMRLPGGKNTVKFFRYIFS
ncbi:hypothetical protein [Paenibacillus radicis (ex Xue et al. 2023)]|uniref:Uncharacterized protein n=1 Tax=Paenibacillus radicis (ex Xue et al. 2023) TaxID=2972489 RepID=A0ABT1YLX0_9BACL|nr:hypothetical protein [Paenibacillus radicis (ex Xue et al. 2023)]MCR8634149.1 hypothetical protein [Paenibacillus radicis (ex Xue et al. 2023)]